MDSEKLIEFVRSNRVLYDPSHPLYLNKSHKGELWNEIGKQLGKTGWACKARWCSLRDNFRQNRKKLHQNRYKYNTQLQFLVPYLHNRTQDFQRRPFRVQSDYTKKPAAENGMPSIQINLEEREDNVETCTEEASQVIIIEPLEKENSLVDVDAEPVEENPLAEIIVTSQESNSEEICNAEIRPQLINPDQRDETTERKIIQIKSRKKNNECSPRSSTETRQIISRANNDESPPRSSAELQQFLNFRKSKAALARSKKKRSPIVKQVVSRNVENTSSMKIPDLLKRYIIELVEETISSMQRHPVDLFLSSLAPVLKTLPPYFLNLVKTKIMEAVQESELAMLEEQRQANSNGIIEINHSDVIDDTE